jgi:hypothetical protein
MLANEPEQAIRADREAHPYHGLFPGLPARYETDEREAICKSHCAPSLRGNDAGKTLGKDLARTLAVAAKEAAPMQFEPYGTAHPRQVGHETNVA